MQLSLCNIPQMFFCLMVLIRVVLFVSLTDFSVGVSCDAYSTWLCLCVLCTVIVLHNYLYFCAIVV